MRLWRKAVITALLPRRLSNLGTRLGSRISQTIRDKRETRSPNRAGFPTLRRVPDTVRSCRLEMALVDLPFDERWVGAFRRAQFRRLSGAGAVDCAHAHDTELRQNDAAGPGPATARLPRNRFFRTIDRAGLSGRVR